MGLFGKSDEQHQDPVLENLRHRMDGAEIPSYVRDVVEREFELLARIGTATTEFTIGLNYIEYLLSMPWKKCTGEIPDIEQAERILDREHYGLHEIKERILEHLSVRKLKMGRRPIVLVVDDEEVVRKNMIHLLSGENYSVVTAKDGLEAITAMEKSEFDVVLTDIKMEKMDGVAILRHVKANSPDTQVIMMTGYATISAAVEIMKQGAFSYISKPFTIEEVLETIKAAVEKSMMRHDGNASVLCFAGPPGTGKTSLGRAIARALGRKFVRISLGGIRDEAEIRGHRKTYSGAMPGRIIDEIRKAGVCNPVIVLDELDKIGQDVKGDPASALLEVLDPEQNAQFMDHYLDIPFNLSGVMFIVTANISDNIMAPLRDRMEIIDFPGYTDGEKLKIAADFLVPRQIRENGLSDNPPLFSIEALQKIVEEYTHEAGIRNLTRTIAALCRKLARKSIQHIHEASGVTITPELVESMLGPRKYSRETAKEKDSVGVTTGLVWTDAGGEIIFIEAAIMAGSQELILTGSLGDIMKESAHTALSYIRSNALRYGIDQNFFVSHDIHVHVPAGAIPKDGPSAGITIVLAILSLLTGRPARRDVAVSGEITLSGNVLPVGGIRDKMLAAKRAGVRHILLPLRNSADLESLPAEIRVGLTISYIENISDAVDLVLKPAK